MIEQTLGDLLQMIRTKYGQCRTYFDSGCASVPTGDKEHPSFDFSFRTFFQRPYNFRFEWAHKFAVGHDASGSYIESVGEKSPLSDAKDLATLAPPGAIRNIWALLVNDGETILSGDEISITSHSEFGVELCHVLEITGYRRDLYKLLVSKEGVILQIKHTPAWMKGQYIEIDHELHLRESCLSKALEREDQYVQQTERFIRLYSFDTTDFDCELPAYETY
ncbi:MAG TPA: hypothetical protein V6C86_02115 [Oculatellaceae cyanobacterium]